MKISQKLEYACRAMVQLAKRDNENTVTRLDEIAQCEDVSANFLVQIMNDLKNADVVLSKRGKAGGYYIGKPLGEVTLYDIVAAVEPTMVGKMPEQKGDSSLQVASAWSQVSQQFNDSLKKITLHEMKGPDNEPMFYI